MPAFVGDPNNTIKNTIRNYVSGVGLVFWSAVSLTHNVRFESVDTNVLQYGNTITNPPAGATAAALPSNSSAGTFSENTTYQNTSEFKLLIVWSGASRINGGWGFIKQRGLIGSSSPTTQVASITDSLSGSGTVEQSASFVVPPGHFWRVTNEDFEPSNKSGVIQRIEAWQIR